MSKVESPLWKLAREHIGDEKLAEMTQMTLDSIWFLVRYYEIPGTDYRKEVAQKIIKLDDEIRLLLKDVLA